MKVVTFALMKKLFPVIICLFLFNSCKKTKPDKDDSILRACILYTQERAQVFLNINEAYLSTNGIFYKYAEDTMLNGSCTKFILAGDTALSGNNYVRQDSSRIPHIKIIYANCTGADGRSRSGTITDTLYNPYKNQAAVQYVYSTSYSSGGYSYSAQYFVLRTSDSSFNTAYDAGSCTIGSSVYTFTANYSYILKNNGTLQDYSDDYVVIKGSLSGIDPTGRKFTATFTNAEKHSDCSWLINGSAIANPAGQYTRSIQFNNTCNRGASFSVNGYNYSFDLP